MQAPTGSGPAIGASPLHSSAPCRRVRECDRASSRSAVLPTRAQRGAISTGEKGVRFQTALTTWPCDALSGHLGSVAPLPGEQQRRAGRARG